MNTTTTERYYFAYGSNLDLAGLRQQWPALVACLEAIGPAWLPDRELAFTRYSARRGGGVLDVRARCGAAVRGMLFRVHGDGLGLLDRKEGTPHAYRRVHHVALLEDGAEVPVFTYEVTDPVPFVQPAPEYLESVRRGREAWDISGSDLEAAAHNKPIEPRDSLFAYGTLMRGEKRFAHLEPDGLRCALLAEAFGSLLDLGDYPGLMLGGCGDDLVQGELVRHRDIGRLLARLDQVEGFLGWSRSGSLFRRAIINVGMGDGRVRIAWTYVFAGTDAGQTIESGDWRAHRGVRSAFLAGLAAAHCGGREPAVARALDRRGWSLDGDGLDGSASDLVRIADALARGVISERQLAQLSDRWVAVP